MYFYFYLIAFSLMGYGFILSIYLRLSVNNFGSLGLLGIINLAIISYLTSLFINHGQIFNFIILLIGITSFFFNLRKFKNLKKELIYFFLIFSLLLLFISIGKNHDDFPYYHFPYIQLLTDYSHPLGLGQLNNGFRSPSSIFFISSLFFLPKIGIYLFHITPAFIMGFANIIFLKNILDKGLFQKEKMISFLSLLFFIFINVFFYRLSEHGTDRSGMILVLLSILFLIALINNQKNSFQETKINEELMKMIIILICFAATIKPYYLINFSIFLLFVFFEHTRKIFLSLFFSRTFHVCLSLIIFTIFFTFINSGCLIFPITVTCFENLAWSLDKGLISQTNVWFELWSKGGAGPNYTVEERLEYISGLNWLSNWFEKYFFNKVFDFLIGILILSFIVFLAFFNNYNSNKLIQKNTVYVFALILLLLLEWFFKHPTLRYGGYHLIALIIFIPLSMKLSNTDMNYDFFFKRSLVLIFVTIIIFCSRNLSRLNNEYSLYNFSPIKNTNYKFIGGDKDFYYRYDTFLEENLNNFKTLEIIGKKFLIIQNN